MMTAYDIANELGQLLIQKKLLLTTAESCTAGQVAETITSVTGSSAWFERGFITYSNIAKHEMLGVSLVTLERFGAVSAQTARAMAEGALCHSHAHISVSVTGIAGPDGGTAEKPVGTVWFAWAGIGVVTQTQQQLFTGDRLSIREQATEFALRELIKFVR